MIIPFDKLKPETLRSLIEEFVTREGTDSGYTKGSIEQNVALVEGQLKKRLAFIVYDENTETCNIVSADYLKKR